ncbi:MAG TPA: DUF721 domain-containing protein, partial [Thermodesulfovibrionales bacterium]|nr:DUF721 domain-containing protein [Thermodesulfovibrionales bacterium]
RYRQEGRLMKKAEAVLGPMLKRLGIESGVKLERIRNDWFDIFEASLASHMYPAGCTEQEILLNVDSPAWMQQFTYYKKDIVRRLAPYGITDARFRIGKIRARNRQTPDRKKYRVLSDDEASFAATVVSGVSDERLKEAIRKAIEKSLAVKRKP